MFIEFALDAFNVINKSEDQKPAAYYMLGNEGMMKMPGLGKSRKCYRGLLFQFSDEGGNTANKKT
jgi:hypothetical protein